MALVFAAGCSYSLPSPLQTGVDDLVQQTAGVHAVVKLQNASDEFAKAADAALVGNTHTTVPDWPAEARSLIVNAYNDRKHKKAAVLIHNQIRIARWDEI